MNTWSLFEIMSERLGDGTLLEKVHCGDELLGFTRLTSFPVCPLPPTCQSRCEFLAVPAMMSSR